MMKISALGDNFVLPELLRDAALRKMPDHEFQWQMFSAPWPQVPFADVAEVHEASGTEAQTIDSIADAEIALTQLAPFTETVFSRATSLKMLGVCRGGPVNVNLDAATEAGVIVSYAPGRNAQAAAEFTLGMMIAAMRRIGDANTDMHRGRWRGDLYGYSESGRELSGNTVGIIGFGAIGRLVAGMLIAIGSKVLVFDPFLAANITVPEGASLVSLEELLSRSRVVTLHARLSPESNQMLNGSNLSLLPEGAVLINSGRAGLIDYSTLPDMLDSGHLGALALDVYDIEPPASSWPLLNRPNVILTPHLAGATRQTAERAADTLADELSRYLAGSTPTHVANPEVLNQFNIRH